MPAVEYRGRTIEPQSYLSDSKWHPKAILLTHESGSRTLPIVAHVDISFGTEHEANVYAVEMTKKWIDERS
jgi:hypothetical protein